MIVRHIFLEKVAQTNIRLRSDGIVEVIATDHDYSVEDIKKIQAAVHEINLQKKALLMLINSQYTTINVEARKYLSTPEANYHSIADAFVIKSLAQRLILNFIIRVQGRPIPTRFFTDEETAIAWLKEMSRISEAKKQERVNKQ